MARQGVGGDLPLCFDFLRLLISGLGWEESSRRHMTRGETTRYAGRLASLLSHARLGLAPAFASVVMVTSLCFIVMLWCSIITRQ